MEAAMPIDGFVRYGIETQTARVDHRNASAAGSRSGTLGDQ